MRRQLGAIAILVLAGCGAEHVEPPDPRCTDAASIQHAAAGGTGPQISECVRRATRDSDLQDVGFAVSRAADRLGAGTDAHALGFLIGAVRRGTGDSGVQAELVNRVEAVARRMTGRTATVQQGIAEGEAHG
jgi:hypothetical protein